jgi:hypothetical protein
VRGAAAVQRFQQVAEVRHVLAEDVPEDVLLKLIL